MGARFIGIGKETTYGTIVPRTVFLDIVSESLNPDHGYIDVEGGAYPEIRQVVPGPYLVDGDVDLPVRDTEVLEVLALVLGHEPTPTQKLTGQVWEWVFLPQSTWLSATLEIAPDIPVASPLPRLLAGALFKSLSIEATARELVTMTIGSHGKKDSQPGTQTSPTFKTQRPFVFFDGAMSVAGSPVASIRAFSLSVERTVPDDIHCLGDRFLPSPIIGGFKVTGSMDVLFSNWDFYKRFWGSLTATEPQEIPETFSIQMKCEGDLIASTYYRTLTIDLPKCNFETSEASIDRREPIIQSLGVRPQYDATTGAAVKFTVQTSRGTLWA